MPSIKLGVVGLSSTGWASISLVPPLLQPALSSSYKLTALSTTNPKSAAAAAAKYSELTSSSNPDGVKAYHGSTEAIASDEEVDMVVVAVRTPAHKEAVMPAIEKGKDVFVEWPLGISLEETMEIAKVAKEKKVRNMIGLQSWQSPVINKVKDWVAEGKIGTLLSSTWVGSKDALWPYWAPYTSQSDAYVLDPKNGASMLHILVGHSLSGVIHALGPFSSLTATSAQRYPSITIIDPSTQQPNGSTLESGVEDQYAISGNFKDSGALFSGTWRCGPSATAPNSKERPSLVWLIDGTEGHIKIESYAPFGGCIHAFPPEKVVLNGKVVEVPEGDLGNTGRAWKAYAEGGVYPTFDDAVVLYQHVDAIERSAREGRRVDVAL